MNIHNNARLTFRGRELLVKRIVEQGLRVEEAAQASGVSVRTAYKWLSYRQEGITGLYDRSSRPRHCPHQTSAHRHQEIVRLRRLRRTYRQISRQLAGRVDSWPLARQPRGHLEFFVEQLVAGGGS